MEPAWQWCQAEEWRILNQSPETPANKRLTELLSDRAINKLKKGSIYLYPYHHTGRLRHCLFSQYTGRVPESPSSSVLEHPNDILMPDSRTGLRLPCLLSSKRSLAPRFSSHRVP